MALKAYTYLEWLAATAGRSGPPPGTMVRSNPTGPTPVYTGEGLGTFSPNSPITARDVPISKVKRIGRNAQGLNFVQLDTPPDKPRYVKLETVRFEREEPAPTPPRATTENALDRFKKWVEYDNANMVLLQTAQSAIDAAQQRGKPATAAQKQLFQKLMADWLQRRSWIVALQASIPGLSLVQSGTVQRYYNQLKAWLGIGGIAAIGALPAVLVIFVGGALAATAIYAIMAYLNRGADTDAIYQNSQVKALIAQLEASGRITPQEAENINRALRNDIQEAAQAGESQAKGMFGEAADLLKWGVLGFVIYTLATSEKGKRALR